MGGGGGGGGGLKTFVLKAKTYVFKGKMDRCYFGCIRVLTGKRMGAVLFMWHARRLEMPPRLKYKCPALLVTRTGSQKKFACGSSGSRVVVGYACLLLSSARLEETSRSCELNPCRDVNAFFMKGF